MAAVNALISGVNGDERIHHHLVNYPFKPNYVEIRIFLYTARESKIGFSDGAKAPAIGAIATSPVLGKYGLVEIVQSRGSGPSENPIFDSRAVYNPDRSDPKFGQLQVISVIDGILSYKVDNPETNRFKVVYQETYDEAKQKLVLSLSAT